MSRPKKVVNWNITVIDEGRIFEHKQTGKIVFVPKQPDAVFMTKCMKMAIKSVIKEARKEG